MSGFVAEDGSLAVSTDDFRAALLGAIEQDDAPAASADEPAREEPTAETPATAQPEAQPETPPTAAATTPPAGDELATLRAELAAIRQEQERQRGTYDNNTTQQREALRIAREEATTLRTRIADLTRTQTDAAETAFKDQIAAWEGQYKAIEDPQQRTAARAYIDAQVAKHEAERQTAEARRATEALAPVALELQRLQASNDIAQGVQRGIGLIHADGAAQLAAEVGAPVEEVRAYLQRPEVVQQYQQVLALMRQAELAGQPVPVGLLAGLGNRDRAYWAERMADRRTAEAREIERNGRELVASGATRPDGGGGAGAPSKSVDTFADVTPEMFAGALGLTRR